MKKLTCPHCGKDSVCLYGDAVIEYDMETMCNQGHVVNNLDNRWLECDECCMTTEDGTDFSDELYKKYKEIMK